MGTINHCLAGLEGTWELREQGEGARMGTVTPNPCCWKHREPGENGYHGVVLWVNKCMAPCSNGGRKEQVSPALGNPPWLPAGSQDFGFWQGPGLGRGGFVSQP